MMCDSIGNFWASSEDTDDELKKVLSFEVL